MTLINDQFGSKQEIFKTELNMIDSSKQVNNGSISILRASIKKQEGRNKRTGSCILQRFVRGTIKT